MINIYTYWIFYLTKDHSIYAYTDNKKIAKQFKKERNMEKFICEKKELEKEEVHYLAEDENGGLLIERMMRTKAKDGNLIEVPIVITKNEDYTIMNVGGGLVGNKIFITAWTNPSVFQKEIRKALKIIKYTECYLMVSHGYDLNTLDTDDLGLFLRYYSDTMKGDI